MATDPEPSAPARAPKLLDQVRQAVRLRHLSPRTEESYIASIRRSIRFHALRHPRELGAADVTRFLASLADARRRWGVGMLWRWGVRCSLILVRWTPRPSIQARDCPVLFEALATLHAGLFVGAAIYITFVEHPARLECGTELAATEFGPSYRRATLMQASLAAVGLGAALVAWGQGRGVAVLIGGLLLGVVIPFTLLGILPTNKRLLDPTLTGNRPKPQHSWLDGASCMRSAARSPRSPLGSSSGISRDRAEHSEAEAGRHLTR
jgi:hypothetical protein